MRKKYEFVAWKDEGVWTAHSPSVAGVYGLGSTMAAAQKDLADAIAELLDYLREIGERAPVPKRFAVGVLNVEA